MPNFFNDYIEKTLSEQKEEVREFIKELVDEDKLEMAITAYNNYIISIPLSLKLFSNIVLDPATRQEIRSYFSLVVAYIIEPGNYLRKDIPSTAFLIDNAYVLHSSLEIAVKALAEEKRNELSEMLEPLKPIFELNPLIKNFIPENILNRQEVIINYLEKLLDVKSSAKEHPIYILPPT